MALTDKETQMYQVDSIEDITPKYIGKTVHAFIDKHAQDYIDSVEYAEGRNPRIMNRDLPDDSGPDNRIPASYARRIINLINGYMYKPGLINYGYGNERDQANLEMVFSANQEPIKTSQIGKQASIHGIGYEYHYVDSATLPRFVKFPAAEVVPIYNKGIEPKVLAFVRFVPEGGDYVKLLYVDDKEITEYKMLKNGDSITEIVAPVRHYYGRVPLVIYRNNEELMGDFEPVEQLIDAYDVLMSDSMNEFDRFAWAYLLLKGISLSEENAEKLKRMRVFENLDETGDVSFLTKQIDTEFIKFMSDLIRSEIHRQSGIPNIEDYDGAGASGKTMTKFIYLMELFTDPKEAYFKEGLKDRLDCINRILKIKGRGINIDEIDIIMNRNHPDNSLEQAEIFEKYDGRGISRETLITNFADFVPNAKEEMERFEEEQGSMIEMQDEPEEGVDNDEGSRL